MRVQVRRLAVVLTCAWMFVIGGAHEAAAQGFISPLIGYNFGGNSNCQQVTGCEDKRLNVGVGLGVAGDVLGFEEEFAYAKDFFGSAPGMSSSVLTLMTNALLIPNVGPIRPYALLGVGLIKTHVEFTPSSVLTSTNNNFGWNIGGGVMVAMAPHVGLRGDIRYFHAFQDNTTVLGIPIAGDKFDFGRASGALVLRF